jgi:hypothetical protein
LTRTLLARFVQPAFLATILARADEGIRLKRKDSHIGVADSRINALAVNGSCAGLLTTWREVVR